jgi:hypothetical protein
LVALVLLVLSVFVSLVLPETAEADATRSGSRLESGFFAAGGRAATPTSTSDTFLNGRLLGRPEDLGQKLQGLGFELNELEAYVVASRSARRQPLDPHDLSRVCDGRNVCKKELHLEKLADFHLVVAVDANAAEADVDRLPLASEKLHSGRANIERCP